MSSFKTPVLRISPSRPEAGRIALAARILERGGMVAFPTETVYGLAARMDNKKAMARLNKVKERPRGKPFTALIADLRTISKSGAKIDEPARRLVKKFWPGPLTVILPSGHREKAGFRMPANRIALELVKKAGVPVAAPSANVSGKRPPKDAAGVLKELDGKIDLAIDGGRSKVGIESTVVDMTVSPPRILREGAVSKKEIYKALTHG